MPQPVVIGLPPHRENIFYSVQQYMDIFKLSDYIMKHIVESQPDVPKMVMFCPTLECGSKLNKFLQFKLRMIYGNSHHNIVDMFNKACSIKKCQEVLESFCAKDSTLRVIVASTSFGMGVDCADIRKIIHWGPPEDLDTYMQETGRAGRDGLPASACMLYGHPGRYVSDSMRYYGKNESVCRRKILYDKFLFSGMFKL